MKFYGDLETYSERPIKHGTYQYAEHCEVMLFAYALEDGPVKVWDMTADAETPEEIELAVSDPSCQWIFQNAMFDRSVLRYRRPDLCPPIERWYDTMVQALTHSLPGALAKTGSILGLAEEDQKDVTGKDPMLLFCKPRPKNSKLRRATRETHPKEWVDFIEYARRDIVAMRQVHKKLPTWNYI